MSFLSHKQHICCRRLWKLRDKIWKLLNTLLVNRVENIVNPFPPVDAFGRIWSRRLLKASWQKEKLFKTSNFSFCQNVFNYFHNHIFICSDFQYFCLEVFKVVCYRFSSWGKRLKKSEIGHYCAISSYRGLGVKRL